MSAGPDPQANAQVIEQERRRLSQRLDEMARMCEGGMPPSLFYSELLQRLIASLAASAGCVWLRTAQGNLQQQFQINMQQVGLETDEMRQVHDGALRVGFTGGQPLALPPRSSMGEGENGQPPPGNPTPLLMLLVPIKQNEEVIGLVEIFQAPNRPPAAVPGFIQYMTLMADLAGRYQRNQLVGQLVGQQQLWTQLEAFARTIHGSLNTTEVAFHIANEGRRLIECDRISVAVRRAGEKATIEAVSGTDVVEKRSNQVYLMRQLCQEVLKWGERLVFTGTKDEALPPKVLEALDAYLQESPSKLLVLMPLEDERQGDGKEKPKLPCRSAVLMECFETPGDTQQTIARLEVVAKHSTSALYNAIEYRRIPMRFLWGTLARLQEGFGGKTRFWVMFAVCCASALIAALVLLPYPLKMEASGQVVPEVRRTVFPPAPGTISKFEVRFDDPVEAGRTIAVMYDSNLFQRISALQTDISSKETQAKHQGSLASNEQNPKEKANYQTQAALFNLEAEAKRRELLEVLKRANAVGLRPGFFTAIAPEMTSQERQRLKGQARWTVLTSNFREQEGKELKPSEPIMRLGVKDGPWEIELKIPQKHIGQVLRAFERKKKNGEENPDVLDVDFILRGDPTVRYHGKLERSRIAGEANPDQDSATQEAEPVVIAYVRIEGEDIPQAYRVDRRALTSNTAVTAKIRCGSAAAGYSLFYGVWEFLYEKVVFFLF